MKSLLLAASAVALVAGAASAQEGPFRVGAGYQVIDTDGATFDTVTLRASYDFNQFFAVEGDLLVGIGSENVTVGNTTVKSSIDYGVGVYGVAQYPLAEQFTVFARGGYIYADVEGSVGGLTVSTDVDGWAFGAGAEWAFAGPNAVRFDYTRYDFVNGNGNADAFGISYVRRF
ncbi:porin family protein [Glycocaulis sp.]